MHEVMNHKNSPPFLIHFKNPFFWVFFAFGPVAFGGGKGMILLLLALFLSCLWTGIKGKGVFRQLFNIKKDISLPFFFLLGIWGYMTVSSFWSFEPLASLGASLRLLGVGLMTVYILYWIRSIPVEKIASSVYGLISGWLLLLVLFIGLFVIDQSHLYELPKRYWPQQIHKPAFLMALFFWPSCSYFIFYSPFSFLKKCPLLARCIFFMLLGVGTLSLLSFFGMKAAPIGLAFGLLGYLILRGFPSSFSSIFNGMIAIGLFFPFLMSLFQNPFFLMYVTRPSWLHRLYIWDFVLSRIKEAPYFGWGLDTSRFFSSHSVTLSHPAQTESAPLFVHLLPLHPHNAFLQMWLEGGMLGACLLALFLGSLSHLLKKMSSSDEERAILGGAFLTFFIPFYVSFGIWQTWWIATQCFFTILWIFIKKTNEFKR